MDIRIISEITLQPVLFGDPIVSSAFLLVDWDTDELVTKERFHTVADAERVAYGIARPYLNNMARECVEKGEMNWN